MNLILIIIFTVNFVITLSFFKSRNFDICTHTFCDAIEDTFQKQAFISIHIFHYFQLFQLLSHTMDLFGCTIIKYLIKK